jgi:hypothetical protein
MSADWREEQAAFEAEKKLQYEQAKFLFDQSKTYNTVIIGLAYGGFFSLWASVNSYSTDKRTIALAGALMAISILAFVGFTILNVYVMSTVVVENANYASLFGNPKSLEEFRALVTRLTDRRVKMNAKIAEQSIWVAKLWRPFFFTAIGSGLLASLIVVFLMLKHVVSG